MVSFRFVSALLVSAALFAPSAFASRVHQAPTSGHSHRGTHKASTKSTSAKSGSTTKAATTKATRTRAKKPRGQQSIDSDRVTAIQAALIREHYLTGEASGNWDPTTIAAMQKFQADQGWQTKLMPDSRALKKLGLGPDYSNAINAQGASFNDPTQRGTTSSEQAAAFAEAAGVHQ